MQDHEGRPARREFLGQLGVMAMATSLPVSSAEVKSRRREAVSPQWDMSWLDRIAAAPYKAVIDSTNLNDGAALDLAADIMDRFHDVYNGPDEQTRIIIVMRQLGVPMALQDALWDRYAIGEDRKINDPATKAPARRNPFLRAAPGEPDWVQEGKVEPLVKRGMTILVCNRAAMNHARSYAERTKRNVEEVQADVRNGLVPGAYLMPDGIFALVRAQNAGCALMKMSS
jgi:intracellular sulfur oxidation DsrE/DsrF family protein